MAGRPSKLTEKQWHEISQRVLDGEPVRALAREYEISEAAIRMRISARHQELKKVAGQIVATEQLVADLDPYSQITTQRIADDMRAISTNLAGAGKLGSIVARTMMEIAEGQTKKINKDDPMESADVLQGIAAVGRVANESSTIGLKLVSTATKEKPEDLKKQNRLPGPDWEALLRTPGNA